MGQIAHFCEWPRPRPLPVMCSQSFPQRRLEGCGRGEPFFLRDSSPWVLFMLLQAPCFQPVGELNNLFGLSSVQLALIYTPRPGGPGGNIAGVCGCCSENCWKKSPGRGQEPTEVLREAAGRLTSQSFSKAPSPHRRISQTNIKGRKSSMYAQPWNNIWAVKKHPVGNYNSDTFFFPTEHIKSYKLRICLHSHERSIPCRARGSGSQSEGSTFLAGTTFHQRVSSDSHAKWVGELVSVCFP